MSERYTKAEVLEALLDGLSQVQHYQHVPTIDDNYISGVSNAKNPVLLLSLANGQHFEIRAKTVRA